MVWQKVRHDFHIYHSLGRFTVHRIGDFYLVAKLGVGGAKLKETKSYVLLDNSYIIHKGGIKRKYSKDDFNLLKLAANYSKSTKANLQRDLLEGKVTKGFWNENNIVTSLAGLLCNVQQKIYHSQSLMLHSFPDVSSGLVSQEEGYDLRNAGEALMLLNPIQTGLF